VPSASRKIFYWRKNHFLIVLGRAYSAKRWAKEVASSGSLFLG